MSSTPPLTPAGLVAEAAEAQPDLPAIVGPAQTLTYAEFDDRVRRLAAGMGERDLQRVACVAADPVTMALVLVAASAVGVEACGYPASADSREIARLLEAFDHHTVVAPNAAIDDLDLSADSVVGVDDLAAATPAIPATVDTAPLLVLTTGTTGLPKGARHDWRRLTRAASRWTSPAGSRWLLAYNLNQFAGIQVLAHAVVSRATLVVPSQLQPRTALAAIENHLVTHVSATPTFWRQALNQLPTDRPGPDLAQITIGGERVPADLVGALQERFPQAHISQVYASTEFGSGAATGDRDNGLPLSVLDRDRDADVQMRVVDGELQIRSRVGMLGYHGEDDLDDDWRRTGDLVEIRDDRLHFVGRTAEIINVGGVKVHPADVEDRVAEADGVAGVHVRGRSNPVTGQIVQADVVAAPDVDRDLLESEIRAACDGLPTAAQPRRIRFVEELDTREHKVRRGGVES